MKIRIEFDIPDEKLLGQKPKSVRDDLKKALVQGLGCLVSDYPHGHGLEYLYEMVKER